MSQESKSNMEFPSSSVVEVGSALESNLKIYDRILATVTALGVVIGGLWGLYNHFELQRHANELRQREFKLMVFKEKKDAYMALIDAAGEIVASKNRQEVSENASQFLKLYLGRAHVIAEADSNVSSMKIAFKNKLDTYLKGQIDEDPFIYFRSTALALTNACRTHVDPRTLMQETTVQEFRPEITR